MGSLFVRMNIVLALVLVGAALGFTSKAMDSQVLFIAGLVLIIAGFIVFLTLYIYTEEEGE